MKVPGPSPIPVVFDVNVLVGAAAGGNSPFRSWPSPPPTSGNPAADSLGVIVDAAEFALWISPHILGETVRVLVEVLAWDPAVAQAYENVVLQAAEHSGGALVDPPATVGECPDWEDNRVLDLVVEVGALMLVSADVDLTAMSPWRGVPILTPYQFAARVDGMRRHRRRH
ncbi:MAG: PIN domain-containing protein [Sporichthyaceae bacterium]